MGIKVGVYDDASIAYQDNVKLSINSSDCDSVSNEAGLSLIENLRGRRVVETAGGSYYNAVGVLKGTPYKSLFNMNTIKAVETLYGTVFYPACYDAVYAVDTVGLLPDNTVMDMLVEFDIEHTSVYSFNSINAYVSQASTGSTMIFIAPDYWSAYSVETFLTDTFEAYSYMSSIYPVYSRVRLLPLYEGLLRDGVAKKVYIEDMNVAELRCSSVYKENGVFSMRVIYPVGVGEDATERFLEGMISKGDSVQDTPLTIGDIAQFADRAEACYSDSVNDLVAEVAGNNVFALIPAEFYDNAITLEDIRVARVTYNDGSTVYVGYNKCLLLGKQAYADDFILNSLAGIRYKPSEAGEVKSMYSLSWLSQNGVDEYVLRNGFEDYILNRGTVAFIIDKNNDIATLDMDALCSKEV